MFSFFLVFCHIFLFFLFQTYLNIEYWGGIQWSYISYHGEIFDLGPCKTHKYWERIADFKTIKQPNN